MLEVLLDNRNWRGGKKTLKTKIGGKNIEIKLLLIVTTADEGYH